MNGRGCEGGSSSSSSSASATSFSSIVEEPEDVAASGTFDKPRLGRTGGELSACVGLAGCCG